MPTTCSTKPRRPPRRAPRKPEVPANPTGRYYFDEAAADRVCRFFEERLVHVDGRFAGKPFVPLPWQRDILRAVFGWKRRDDGTRRYRTAYIEVPRKNGKSAFASGIALYMLAADGEAGAQVYSAAMTAEQAGIVFKVARRMVAANPQLEKRLELKQYAVEHPSSGSIFKALSGESSGSHGRNIHALLLDEMHEWTTAASAELFEALVTSMGARTQPLVLQITTAGHGGNETLCRTMHDKAVKALAGETDDETFYAAIFAADPRDDWRSPETWAKANPSLGETVTESYLAAEAIKAAESPSYLNTFLRLYLNVWTEQQTRWLSMELYDAAVRPVDESDLARFPCYVGTDLAAVYDFAAMVALYVTPEGQWIVVPKLYLPAEAVRQRTRDDRNIPITRWADDGHVIATDGTTVDYDRIEQDVRGLAAGGKLKAVAFDPFNAAQMMGRLDRDGITTVEVKQGFFAMSAACKEIERRLATGEIAFADNPALRFMFANVEVEQDRHQNIRPVKPRRTGKSAGTAKLSIDGVVATVLAATRAMLHDPTQDEADHDGPSARYL